MRLIHLDKPQYWLHEISRTFHGRDIFAPCGAHLANGVPLEEMGALIDDPVRLHIPQPERTPTGWRAPIIHQDHFGNLALNLRREQLPSDNQIWLHAGNETINGLSETFSQRAPGSLVAVFDSSSLLSIAVVNGSAASRLGLAVGDWVKVVIQEPQQH